MTNPIVSASNDFAMRLYERLQKAQGGENIFISPFSIAAVLTMTYNGALNQTQQDMAQILGLTGLSIEEINHAYALLRSLLVSHSIGTKLAIANSLWARAGLLFDPVFRTRCIEDYAAKIASLDFTDPQTLQTINDWVESKTQNKIKKLLKPGDINAQTVLVLINAVYFKGIWQKQFNPAKTKEGLFNLLDGNQQKCAMMHQNGGYAYLQQADFQAISLPYGDGHLSMLIFLPDPSSSLAQFHQQLNTEHWENWLSKFQETQIDLSLPRFKIEYEIELSETLAKLGMGIIFGPQADFRAMFADTGNLAINQVRHKTFLDVNEEGSEAAAATAVVMLRKAMPSKRRMSVDRPFFCAIRDNQSGAILFMGSILKPESTAAGGE